MSFRTVYGYTHSENGWRMCDRNECERIYIPGADNDHMAAMIVRSGDAEIILRAWAIWYHHNVEPLDRYKSGVGDDWGWSATNDVPNSNHLSGTALDFNASQYPWGSRTMPADRIAKVRKGLKLFEGSIFWGADWSRADEMHYQIGWPEGDRRVRDFANKLRGGYLGLIASEKPVENRIDAVAAANSWLGKRITKGENVCPDGRGRWAEFEAGYVYWSPDTNAYAIPDSVFDVYARLGWEAGILGYPTRSSERINGGVVQAFQGGTIYRKDGTDGAHVRGLIGKRWADEGFENGPLGWPMEDERAFDKGTVQHFEHGTLFWAPTQVLRLLESE